MLKGCKGQKDYKRSRPSMEHLSQMFSSIEWNSTSSGWAVVHVPVSMEPLELWCFHFRFASFDWRRATPVVFSELISAIICDPHHFLKMSFGTCLSWAHACTCNSSFLISQPYEASIFVARCHIGLIVSENVDCGSVCCFIKLWHIFSFAWQHISINFCSYCYRLLSKGHACT